ncbi:transcriptional regulator ATRX-like isoform X1 [Engraulis encrasicolus]|uniref:transcriptional regulator ATRX-like isoform X1 n=1 Tax=Engraulis encrasicolus TaxID=184585 RepID=UPI002FD462E0
MTLKYSVSSQSEMLKNGREGGKYEMQHDTGSSDSDSGNSLFITQAVTPTLPERRRRHRAASQSISSPFHIPDSENEELGQHVHHRETDAGRSRQKKTKYGRRIISFPSFQKPGEEATLSGQQRQMFVNSSIGGFFQFIEKLSKAGEASGFSSGEISQSSDLEEEKEQDGDNHQDIKVVDAALFFPRFRSRCRDVWVCKKSQEAAMRESKTKRCHAKDNKITVHPHTPTVSERLPQRSVRRSAALRKSTPILDNYEQDKNKTRKNKTRKRENPCTTQVLQTSHTGQDHSARHGTPQRPHASARVGKLIDFIAGSTSDDETDIEDDNFRRRPLSIQRPGHGGSLHGPRHVDRSTDRSCGTVSVNKRTGDGEPSTVTQVCSATPSCSRNNDGELRVPQSPVAPTETETCPGSAVDGEDFPLQVHTGAASDQTGGIVEGSSVHTKSLTETILSDATATVGVVPFDDDESQSLLGPQALWNKEVGEKITSCESFQGATSIPAAHHRTEMHKTKDDTFQNKTDAEASVFSKGKSHTGGSVLQTNNGPSTTEFIEQSEIHEPSLNLDSVEKGKKSRDDEKNEPRSANEHSTHNGSSILQDPIPSPSSGTEGETSSLKMKKANHKNKQNSTHSLLIGNNEESSQESVLSSDTLNIPKKKNKQKKKDKKEDTKSISAAEERPPLEDECSSTQQSHVGVREGHKEKGKKKSNSWLVSGVDLHNETNTDTHQAESETCLSPVSHKKKKKKKSRDEMPSEVTLEDTNVTVGFAPEKGSVATARLLTDKLSNDTTVLSEHEECPALLTSEKKKKKKKSKQKESGDKEDGTLLSALMEPILTAEEDPQPKKKNKKKEPQEHATVDQAQHSGLTQAQSLPVQSEGHRVGDKRKNTDDTVQTAEALPAKKKKKKHRIQGEPNSETIKEFDENHSQGHLDVAEREAALPHPQPTSDKEGKKKTSNDQHYSEQDDEDLLSRLIPPISTDDDEDPQPKKKKKKKNKKKKA